MGPKVQAAVKRMARRVGIIPPSCVSAISDGSVIVLDHTFGNRNVAFSQRIAGVHCEQTNV
jgi:hypothetical protein